MRTRYVLVAIVLLTALLAALHFATRISRAQPSDAATEVSNDPASNQALTEHGRYIVHHVAMCIYCHTPRSNEGVLDPEQLLQGAPMPVESPFAGHRWAFQAPKLAGLPGGWSEEQLTRFLQTGETITGRAPLPPMPPFRMTEHDAVAVAAYLKSLQ
jgi:mono/diheme cytochrome c family protein